MIKKLVSGLVIMASVLTIFPVGASAEWRKDSKGWWNTEGNSYSIGWKQIDGSWYYFDNNGFCNGHRYFQSCIAKPCHCDICGCCSLYIV